MKTDYFHFLRCKSDLRISYSIFRNNGGINRIKHNTYLSILFDILRNKENFIWNYKPFIEIVNTILGISHSFLFPIIVFVIVNILFEIMNRIYTFFPSTVWSEFRNKCFQFLIKKRLICRLTKRENQAFDSAISTMQDFPAQ